MKYLFAIAVALLAAAPGWGQISVRADVTDRRVAMGDTVTFQIAVEGTQGVPPPDLSGLDGFKAEYRGASQNVQIVNGQMSQTVVMQWQLTPTRKGRLTIPAIKIAINNQAYQTEAIQISVVEPAESPDFKLKVEASKTTAYVGEPVKVTFKLFMGKEARAPVVFTGPDGGKTFDIAPGPDPRGGNVQPNARGIQPHPEVTFLGGKAVGTLGEGELDGVPVATFMLDAVVTPRQAGSIAVGPYSVAIQVVTGKRQSDFLGPSFVDRSITRRQVIPSNAITLEARPLPSEGRPAGFSGLIGEYSIASSATARDVNVGDPIPFSVRIKGPEPMDSVAAPDLFSMPGFEHFKPAPEGWQTGQTRTGERVFNTTIRPRSDKVKEIPPVELSFFDTASGQYRTARSSAIPLKVAPTREVTSADAISAPGKHSASGAPLREARPLTAGPGGVYANYEGDDVLEDEGVSFVEFAGSPGGAALLAGPPAICFALSIARGRAASNSPAGRRRRAIIAARRLVRRADSHQAVGAAVAAYIGGALNMEPSAITSTDARSLLTASGSALGEKAERLLAACEYARYGDGSPAETAQLKGEASQLIAELHGELGRIS